MKSKSKHCKVLSFLPSKTPQSQVLGSCNAPTPAECPMNDNLVLDICYGVTWSHFLIKKNHALTEKNALQVENLLNEHDGN